MSIWRKKYAVSAENTEREILKDTVYFEEFTSPIEWSFLCGLDIRNFPGNVLPLWVKYSTHIRISLVNPVPWQSKAQTAVSD